MNASRRTGVVARVIAAEGLGPQQRDDGELADRRAGSGFDQDAPADEDLHASGQNGVEAVLDRARFDQHHAGVEDDLFDVCGDRREETAWRRCEQVDAVQRGHPLDDQHRLSATVDSRKHGIVGNVGAPSLGRVRTWPPPMSITCRE